MGEGLRRLLEQSGISTGFLLSKRMLLVVGGVVLATIFIMNNTGPAPWFTKVAEAYDSAQAFEHVQTLTAMEGRGANQEGGKEAAAYIAEKFQAYGLEPGWKRDSFIYPLETQLVRPLDQPFLALEGIDGQESQEFRHQLDFGFVIQGHGGSGEVMAPLTFVGFEYEPDQYDWESFAGLDLRDRIVLLLEGNAPPDFATEALIHGTRGVLWITGEGSDDVRSQVQLADPNQEYASQPTIPIFRIRPKVANALLQGNGTSLSELLLRGGETPRSGPGWFTKDVDAAVRMSLRLGEPETVEIPCILGVRAGSDYDLSGQLVILFAAYDGLGIDADGTFYPAANHNASSVGLLLDLARVWDEQDLNPRRSVVFVAWGGGQLDDSGAREFVNDSRSFPFLSSTDLYRGFAPAVIIQPDYVGAGGDALFIHPDSDNRLATLLREAVSGLDIAVTSDEANALPYDDIVSSNRSHWLHFTWSDPDVPPDKDSIEQIEPEKLQALGEAISLVLTQIVRQSNY